MKKIVLLCLALFTAAVLSACNSKNEEAVKDQEKAENGQETEITLWTFPVGNWGNQTAVSGLITSFQREYPDIRVNVECMSYDNGDQKIREAVAEGNAPDLVFEGPERLVADWGDQGYI